MNQDDQRHLTILLSQWKGSEGGSIHRDPLHPTKEKNASLVRRIVVAYAAAKVLQHALLQQCTIDELQSLCSIDNFIIRASPGTQELSEVGWEVTGVTVIQPETSVQIRASWPSSRSVDPAGAAIAGRNVEGVIIGHSVRDANNDLNEGRCDSKMACYLLGRFLHSFFSDDASQQVKSEGLLKDESESEPSPKRPTSSFQQMKSLGLSQQDSSTTKSESGKMNNADVSDENILARLCNFGYPAALSQLVTNLLDCGAGLFCSDDSFKSLDEVMDDLRILLQDPGLFLFNQHQMALGGRRIPSEGGKLYGRAKEVKLLKDSFSHVASAGVSEIVHVSGSSGCGKTCLVQSIFDHVEHCGGYVVHSKFEEETTRSPFSVVLSAFDRLCGLVAEKRSLEERQELYRRLEEMTDVPTLSTVLPSIMRINPTHADTQVPPPTHTIEMGPKYHMTIFAMMRLMRVLSSQRNPAMIFLDDIHNADDMALRFVQAILCDRKRVYSSGVEDDGGCIFFVSGYSDKVSVQRDCQHVTDFIHFLRCSDVPCDKICLKELTEGDVNLLLSESLGVVPRLSKSLSNLVHQKTKGNAFYVYQFFESLINKGIVKFSLRERQWLWDIDAIALQQVTENVVDMIIDKMNHLKKEEQLGLQVAACLGIKFDVSIVQELSKTALCANLQSTLDGAVEVGFLERNESQYCFIHDKIRGAALTLIDNKVDFFHSLGMLLYSKLTDPDWIEKVPVVLELINYGVPSLITCEEKRAFISELNYRESVKALDVVDFNSAHMLANKAISLLPDNPWADHYDQSIKYFLQVAKAAYSCGDCDAAKGRCTGYVSAVPDYFLVHCTLLYSLSTSQLNRFASNYCEHTQFLLKVSINAIIDNGNSLQDKCVIEAYFLLISILLLESKDLSGAFGTCCKILAILGVEVSDLDEDGYDLSNQVTKTKAMLEDSDLLSGQDKTKDWKSLAIMEAFYQIVFLTYLVRPDLHFRYVVRWVQYTVTNGVFCCRTPGCVVSFGALLCKDLGEDARYGYDLGKRGINMLDGPCSSELPDTFLIFYAYIAVLFEPIQACVDMHRRGHHVAMMTGNLQSAAAHKATDLGLCFITGQNLLDLKNDLERELDLATRNSQLFLVLRLRCLQETILSLLGEESTGMFDFTDEMATNNPTLTEAECLLEMMAAIYLGKTQRLQNLARHWEIIQMQRDMIPPYRRYCLTFFGGLAASAMFRQKSDPAQLAALDVSITNLERAASLSDWNFRNKVALLKAERASIKGDYEEAELQYGIAISSAQTSKFVHEEALACEFAARHFKHNDVKNDTVLNLFRHAAKCYQKWGSDAKVDQMAYAIASIHQ